MDETTEPLAISAMQHWAYWPRQCGLIHLEPVFDDNLHTLLGNAMHAQADRPGLEVRRGLRVERALPLFSDRLGLIGPADTVESEPDGTPYPVEYKHGSHLKAADIAACDDLQLAAQALCLEEMTGHTVPEGALCVLRRRSVSVPLMHRRAERVWRWCCAARATPKVKTTANCSPMRRRIWRPANAPCRRLWTRCAASRARPHAATSWR